jgi:hypothetical protein
MTPQEKAKELVDRFRGELKYGQRHWGKFIMPNNALP